MALAVVFIILFGTAALVPAVWSIIGLIGGNTKFWPCVAGTGFALILLIITLIGIFTNWGGCPVTCDKAGNCGSSEGSIQCFQKNAKGDWVKQCEPDVWKEECKQSVSCVPDPKKPQTSFPIAAGQHCPTGANWTTVYSFCEPIQTGGVKQPWATWSDLSFLASGLWLLWLFQYFGTWPSLLGNEGDNPMSSITVLSVVYCFIVIFMGPPSMWYHASMKSLGGWFDTMSVVAWLGFNASYVAYLFFAGVNGNGRDGWWQPGVVLGVWIGVSVLCGILAAVTSLPSLVYYFFTGGGWGIAELAYVIRAQRNSPDVKYRRNWRLTLTNVLVLAATMGVWIGFNDGIVKQHCSTGFPGHALFHILASVSTMLTYFSFSSEQHV